MLAIIITLILNIFLFLFYVALNVLYVPIALFKRYKRYITRNYLTLVVKRYTMNKEITWHDAIEAADSLIELYQQRTIEYPELKRHYQQRTILTLKKKLLAVEALKKTQELGNIIDEYLEEENVL